MTPDVILAWLGKGAAVLTVAWAAKKWLWPVAKGIYTAFNAPKEKAEGEAERADIWKAFNNVNQKLDRLLLSDDDTRERVAVLESQMREVRGDVTREAALLKSVANRITNVEAFCEMRQRRANGNTDSPLPQPKVTP
jgi:hypothetical protein